ncbi:tetratricopeptide repeat protein [Rhodococcus opacus]
MRFVPVVRMEERAALAKSDSDTSYFFDLMYMGEIVLKTMLVELISGLEKTTERHRYQVEYELVRADSLGKWQAVLDALLRGPASQNFCAGSRESVGSWSAKFAVGSTSWQRLATEALAETCDLLDVAHAVDLQRKVSLDDWSKMFVALRNRTRGHGATRSTNLDAASSSLEVSLRAITTEGPAFNRSWAYLKRSLSGKYRVSCFGGDRNDFANLTKQDQHTFEDGVYVYLGRPVKTTLISTDVDLTDFFLSNGNYRNGRMEYISYITDSTKEVVDHTFTLPVEARRKSETSAAPEMDVVGETFSNIPQPPDGYVRRDRLEAELMSVLADARNPVVTLKGRGGVGKTSLALAVLHAVVAQPNYFAVIWFSARDIDLLAVGPKEVRPDVLSLDDIAHLFCRLIHPDMKFRDAEARNFMAECLSGESSDGPFLFVFDNFETIREQAHLYAFVNTCIRLPNKVLITTRTADFKSDYPIDVGGMNREEYDQLIRETARKLSIEALLSKSYEDELYVESNGHPYITKVLLGEVAASRKKSTLKRVIASQDNLLNALFERSFSNLSAAGQRVFLILCSWRSAVPRLGLEAVMLRPENERIDVRRAIEELEKFSLIDPVANDESGQFLSVPQSATVFGKKKLVTSSFRAAVESDMEFLRGFGNAGPTDVSRGLLPRIRKFAAFIAKSGNAADVEQGLAVLEFIANDYSPAWLILAELYQEFNDVDKSVLCLNRYLQENPDDRSAWSELARLHRHRVDLREEAFALTTLAETSLELSDISVAVNSLNRLLASGETIDSDERALMIRKLRALVEPHAGAADATDLSRLAWLCMSDRDLSAARKYVEMGLRVDASNQHCVKLQAKLNYEHGSE